MESTYGLILALFLVSCIFFTGCITEDTPATGPVGGGFPQEGVPIQNIGDVTGQGIILQGVPRGTVDTITFAIGLAPGELCQACITGQYPTACGQKLAEEARQNTHHDTGRTYDSLGRASSALAGG